MKFDALYIFVQVDEHGNEQIATHKNAYGNHVPLIYPSIELIDGDQMIAEIQRKAKNYKLTFHLRKYEQAELIGTFEPEKGVA